MITHRHVEVFRAIMLTGSMTKAAQLLRTSQPTVSRELARVEQVFGFCLFDRTRGRLKPTHSAISLYEEVTRSFVGLERINACVVSLRQQRESGLSVIALPAFTQSLLPGACRRLLMSYPSANVSMHAQEPPFLDEWLSAQRYDLGLTEQETAPVGTRLTPLLEVDEVCVLPDGHPLLVKSELDISDFDGQATIAYPITDPYQLRIDALFASYGVERRVVAQTHSAVSVCNLVRNGLGVAIVNPLTALHLCGDGLHARRLSVRFPFQVSIVVPEHRPVNALIEPFIRALHEEAAAIRNRLSTLFEGCPGRNERAGM
jgi:DNA-binding transcriptional LysR family regulator